MWEGNRDGLPRWALCSRLPAIAVELKVKNVRRGLRSPVELSSFCFCNSFRADIFGKRVLMPGENSEEERMGWLFKHNSSNINVFASLFGMS